MDMRLRAHTCRQTEYFKIQISVIISFSVHQLFSHHAKWKGSHERRQSTSTMPLWCLLQQRPQQDFLTNFWRKSLSIEIWSSPLKSNCRTFPLDTNTSQTVASLHFSFNLEYEQWRTMVHWWLTIKFGLYQSLQTYLLAPGEKRLLFFAFSL